MSIISFIFFELAKQPEDIFGSLEELCRLVKNFSLITKNHLDFLLKRLTVDLLHEHNIFEYSEAVIDSKLLRSFEWIGNESSVDENHKQSIEGSEIIVKPLEEN